MNTNNQHETYVSLRTAKMLKVCGFDWECNTRYDTCPVERFYRYRTAIDWNDEGPSTTYSAPTLAVAQRWLREVKHRWVSVECEHAAGLQYDGLTMYMAELYDDIWGYYYTSYWDDDEKRECKKEHATYEEALEDGIYNCLILINKA